MAFTAGIIAIVGTGYSAYQQKKQGEEAASARARSEALQKKRANVKSARERAKQVRQARAARASALAQSAGSAGTGGSGLVGVQSNIGNQVAGNIGFLNKNQEISDSISNLNIASGHRQAKYGSRAAYGSAVSGIASSVGGIV